LFNGKAATPEKRLSGEHEDQLPLNNQVITFDGDPPAARK
jgi:hypothetical protein